MKPRWNIYLNILAGAGIMLFAAPASMAASDTAAASQSSIPAASPGDAAVTELRRRYAENTVLCSDAKLPAETPPGPHPPPVLPPDPPPTTPPDSSAVQCSGILLRALAPGDYTIWNDPKPLPDAHASYAFLRHDVTLRALHSGRVYGYIIYPPNIKNSQEARVQYKCAYPVFADSDHRSQDGCYIHENDRSNFRLACDGGTPKAESWLAKMRGIASKYPDISPYVYACQQISAGEYFPEFLKAIALADKESFKGPNEVVMLEWRKKDKETAPIEAFFYLSGNSAALKNVQKERIDFYENNFRDVPIIRLTLPGNGSGDASFAYAAADQNELPIVAPEFETRTPLQIATDMQGRVEEARLDCKSNLYPAYLCSGILLRGYATTEKGASIWKIKDKDKTKGGISASYLRQDAIFTKLAYDHTHGLVFYPQLLTPRSLSKVEVLCAFPIDSYSDQRRPTACDAVPAFDKGVACQKHSPPILTASAWLTDFTSKPAQDRRYAQCGFDLLEGQASLFMQVLAAARQIDPGTLGEHETTAHASPTGLAAGQTLATDVTQNEFILALWDDTSPHTLPIEAVFYVSGSTVGRTSARADQRALATAPNGRWVPIVRVALPSARGETPQVTYSPDDQEPGITIPR